MDGKQYDEALLKVLTFCENLDEPAEINYREDNLFGMSQNDFIQMVSDLISNNFIKAELCLSSVFFISLTHEGRKELEQLREKIWKRTWYMQTWHWICDIWWIHVPVLITTLYYFCELLKSLFDFLKSFTS